MEKAMPNQPSPNTPNKSPNVGLMVTCLADLFRPNVAFAAVELLEAAGCKISVPEQSCCGQPGYNNGDQANTEKVAQQNIRLFLDYDYVVAPSGSCAAMVKHHYPKLFEQNSSDHLNATKLAEKTYELTQFLSDVMGLDLSSLARTEKQNPEHHITYHDSCSGLRELGVYHQPRSLLKQNPAIHLHELPDANVCCGFGGTFCVKYEEISDRMATQKISAALSTRASTLVMGDLGCLLNLEGKVHRDCTPIEVKHVAEVLAEQLPERD